MEFKGRNRVLMLCIAAFAVLSLLSGASAMEMRSQAFTEQNVAIQIDGVEMEFDPAPYILPPGRTMVPMRALFETLGAQVEWDGETRTVTGRRGDRSVQLTIGSHTALIDGEPHHLDVAPTIRHDRTFIPLRFVAESLDSFVHYDGAERRVSVRSIGAAERTIALAEGSTLHFRLMMVRLFLPDRWTFQVESAGAFPAPVTYVMGGTLDGEEIPVVRRRLEGLVDGLRFMPSLLDLHERETAPWVSATVYEQLKSHGTVADFRTGGFGAHAQSATTLKLQAHSTLTLNQDLARIQVKVLEAITTEGDRFWILDDPANPLVVKFQPTGMPLVGSYGTVGYQLESVESGR